MLSALVIMLSAQAAAAAVPAPAQNKVVCKPDSKVGSRIAKKTCRTVADWEADWKLGNTGARRMYDGMRSQGTNNQ